jgi:ribonuclease P protein component
MATALLRLKRREDFLRVAAARRRWVTPAFILQARERSREEQPDRGAGGSAGFDAALLGPVQREVRVGFTVSRKVGNAVVRNRVRRRLRAAAAAVLPTRARPGFDLVLIGRTSAMTHPFEHLKRDLEAALGRLGAGAGEGR